MFLAKHCPDVETAINEISKHIKENYNDLFLNVTLTNKYSSYTSREFKSLSNDTFFYESLKVNLNELDQIKGILQFNKNEKLKWFSFIGSSKANHILDHNIHCDLSDDFENTENFEFEDEEYLEEECSEDVVTSEINPKEGITLLLNQNKNIKIEEYVAFAFKSKMYENVKEYIKDVFSNFNNNNSFLHSNPPLFPAMFIKRSRNT